MGILTSGILGPVENKTGAVIGKLYRGRNVITGLYRIPKRRKKASAGQVDSRYKFTILNDYLRSIQMLIDDGFRKLIKHNTPINAAYTYNSDHAFILNEDKIELNYPEIMFSVGDVEGPEAPELSSENGLIILKWFNMPQSLYCQYSDKASVLIYEPNKKSSIIYKSAGIRSELEVALKAHCYVNKDVHCFISFSSADGKRQGNSIYLGMLKVLN